MRGKKGSAFSNKLSKAEAERLALLIEEASEVSQIACKILRHGYDSPHPHSGTENIALLEGEIGDLQTSIAIMLAAADVSGEGIMNGAARKLEGVQRWLHHQPKSVLEAAAKRLGVLTT